MPSIVPGQCKNINNLSDQEIVQEARILVALSESFGRNVAAGERADVHPAHDMEKNLFDLADNLSRNGFGVEPSRRLFKYIEHVSKSIPCKIEDRKNRLEEFFFSSRNMVNSTVSAGGSIIGIANIFGYIHLSPERSLANGFNVAAAAGESIYAFIRAATDRTEGALEIRYKKKASADLLAAYRAMNMELPEAARRMVQAYPPMSGGA